MKSGWVLCNVVLLKEFIGWWFGALQDSGAGDYFFGAQ